jgi:hypothetical protein
VCNLKYTGYRNYPEQNVTALSIGMIEEPLWVGFFLCNSGENKSGFSVFSSVCYTNRFSPKCLLDCVFPDFQLLCLCDRGHIAKTIANSEKKVDIES